MKSTYNPETYWTEVAGRIDDRGKEAIVAGDDEPYYRYKRRAFLKLLNAIDFKNKSVLEVGCGPGGNLLEILKLQPRQLTGVDLSEKMVALAKSNLPSTVDIIKSTPQSIPLPDHSFDLVFTATVLQHNTEEAGFNQLLHEIGRISSHKIILFERVENSLTGNELCMGRPLESFTGVLNKHNFKLVNSENINIRISYWMAGIIRKMFNSKRRVEGEVLSTFSIRLQNILLPWTSRLDRLFKLRSDLTKLEFERDRNV